MIWILFLPLLSFAAPDIATSMVPRGKLIETWGRDYIVRSRTGTNIGVQFSLDGKFEEATGKNLNKGDELEPGEGLLSLSTAAQIMHKRGLTPEGYWVIEKDEKHGWIYEFNRGILNAKTGEIIKAVNAEKEEGP